RPARATAGAARRRQAAFPRDLGLSVAEDERDARRARARRRDEEPASARPRDRHPPAGDRAEDPASGGTVDAGGRGGVLRALELRAPGHGARAALVSDVRRLDPVSLSVFLTAGPDRETGTRVKI